LISQRAPEVACESGQECSVVGRLSSRNPWEALLETSNGCFATAVPESFALVAKRFNGKVQVVGKAFPQPVSTPGSDMYYYTVRGYES
jgi:hypothetical protein